MRSFNNGRGSRSSFRRSSDKPEMYDAVCDDCGKDCKVPFKPTGSKPIYCSRCFEKHDDSSSSGGFRKSFSDKPEMYDAVCDECGKDCKVPFSPSSDKPIYCSDCFEKRGGGNSSSRRSDQSGKNNYKDEFEGIHKRLDQIMAILESKD